MELVESKKRSEFGGGQVKGSELEREMVGWKRRKLKLMVCFPQGMASLSCEISVTPSTPCRLEGLGVSASGRVCVGTHALTGQCVQVQACTKILIKWLFMFLHHLLLQFEQFELCFVFLSCLLSFHVWFMSVLQCVSSVSTSSSSTV